MEVIQGNDQERGGWSNAGVWQLKPDGHFAKSDGTDVHPNESLWLLLDKTGKVIAPSWMKQAVEAPSSNSCNANTQRANANCFDYECVLMKQCLQRLVNRASSAHQVAKNACTKMQNKQANDHEKKCCLTLLAPCELENRASFAHVMVNGGYLASALLLEQDMLSQGKALSINSSADAGLEDEAGLDESLTDKRSC
jgi:hypothetical protein